MLQVKASKYYDERGHLRYVLSAKELTELAKEVAAAIQAQHGVPVTPAEVLVSREVLKARGIVWCDDE